MSGGTVGMHFNSMSNIITDLQFYTRQIRDWVTTLETNTEKSLASWDGAAKAQYHAEKAIWRQAITEMEQGLTMHGDALSNITDTTYRGDRKVQAGWENVGKPV
jgi:WXG100 family type VII secretion target